MADDAPRIEAPAEEEADDLFETPDDALEFRLLEEAEADIAAGRFVRHEKVREWLGRVGTPEETPMPDEWLR